MISWGHMTEAYFPVSGLPSAVSLWSTEPLGLLLAGYLHHILRQQIHSAEGGSETTHGFFISQGDGLTGGDADIFFEIGDEGDQADTVERRGFAEETGLAIGLLQSRLAELAPEGSKAAQDEGEGLFVGEHG